jgi:hypothetical protein
MQAVVVAVKNLSATMQTHLWASPFGATPQNVVDNLNAEGQAAQILGDHDAYINAASDTAPGLPLAMQPGWSYATAVGGAVNLMGPASVLVVTGLATVVHGQAVQTTANGNDTDGNVSGSYNGTCAVTCSDAKAVFPATVTFGQGVASFSVTFNTVGPQTLTLTDATNNLSVTVQVTVT